MAAFLATLAAICFALGLVLQQKGTLETPAAEDDPRFLLQILHKPVWLAGGCIQAVGWVLQAVALSKGPLVVVQSITTLSLVIALPIGAWLTHQQITRKVVMGAVAMLVGILLFLTVGSPSGGTQHPSAADWWSAIIVTSVLASALTWLGTKRNGAQKALLFGCAAGFGFAMQAAVTKEFDSVVGSGAGAVLSSWTTYALIISAVVGFGLQQSALKTGVLAPAMASSNAVTLVVGVILGVTVFGESLGHGSGHFAPAVIGLGLAVAGVILLAGAPPPETEPARPTPQSRPSPSPA
jgi:drug/metabolite transporter (DMT)-like permease